MATIYNSELTKELVDAGKLQINMGSIPNQIADKVVPVVEVNPRLLKVSKVLGSLIGKNVTTAGTSIIAADNTKDYFITEIIISNSQDAACDNTNIKIDCTIGGGGKVLFSMRKPTTTAQNFTNIIPLSTPLKIDRNTAVTLSMIFGAGTCITDVIIYGYTNDNPLA